MPSFFVDKLAEGIATIAAAFYRTEYLSSKASSLQRMDAEEAMATAIARDRHVWDCSWSKLSYRLVPENEPDHRETLWLCTKDPGTRRPVTEEECSTCPRWELDPHNRSV